MSRKEEVATKAKFIYEHRIYGNLRHKWTYVSQGNKDRPNEDKEGNAFSKERNSFWVKETQRKNEHIKDNGPVYEERINIKRSNIAQDNIGHRVACLVGGVNSCVKVYNKTRGKKDY
jgi:hypothetical protein